MNSSKSAKHSNKKKINDDVILSETLEEMANHVVAENAEGDRQYSEKEYSALLDELKRRQNEGGELNDKYIRLLAEFDNFKKRNNKELGRLVELEMESLFLSILPVVDDLERALNHTDIEKEQLIEGIRLVHGKLLTTLKKFDVEPFNSVGQAFDPDKHNALMTRTDESCDDQTVLEEFEKGYTFNSHVFRHAKVIVSVKD